MPLSLKRWTPQTGRRSLHPFTHGTSAPMAGFTAFIRPVAPTWPPMPPSSLPWRRTKRRSGGSCWTGDSSALSAVSLIRPCGGHGCGARSSPQTTCSRHCYRSSMRRLTAALPAIADFDGFPAADSTRLNDWYRAAGYMPLEVHAALRAELSAQQALPRGSITRCRRTWPRCSACTPSSFLPPTSATTRSVVPWTRLTALSSSLAASKRSHSATCTSRIARRSRRPTSTTSG